MVGHTITAEPLDGHRRSRKWDSELLFLRRISWRRCGRLSLGRSRFLTLQHGARPAVLDGIDGERDRRKHEQHGGDRRSLRQGRSRTARPKRRLATLPAESGRNIASLAALQQDNNDEEQAHNYMNDGDENNHWNRRS